MKPELAFGGLRLAIPIISAIIAVAVMWGALRTTVAQDHTRIGTLEAFRSDTIDRMARIETLLGDIKKLVERQSP